MIKVCLKEEDWVDFKTCPFEIEKDTPYWFKLSNGNIVLSVWLNTNEATGWAKVAFDEGMSLVASHNHFYLMKDAKIQLAEQPVLNFS